MHHRLKPSVVSLLALTATLASPPAHAEIRGYIDVVRVNSTGGVDILGWSCDGGQEKQIDVHVYVGAAAGNPGARMVASGKANANAETAVGTACGTKSSAHRFGVSLPRAEAAKHANQKIFVHGLSVTGGANLTLNNSGAYAIPKVETGIDGYLDRIETQSDGSATLIGWACDRFNQRSIDVHVYAGGAAGAGGRFITAGKANVASEPAVSDRCRTSKMAHRFRIPLTARTVIANSKKAIYVHGISVSGGPNSTINKSGSLSLPQASANQKLSSLVDDGGDLTIPAGITAIIDRSIDVRNVMVMGRLVCPETGNFTLRLAGLHVHGNDAVFQCGTPERPFRGKLVVSVKPGVRFTGDHCHEPETPCSDRNLMAMGGGAFRFQGDGKNSRWLRLARTAAAGDREIRVSENVAWSPGDQVALSPTGANFLEAEELTVESVKGDTVRFTSPLKYGHIGATESYKVGDKTWTTDERAEVANLSRNIKFVSDGDRKRLGEKGAHMMVMLGGAAYIDGVEFDSMGRMGEMARYPFHWHRSGDVAGQFIKNSSIHHSFQRCVTVHGTLNAVVDNNVCYDHYAHGFFLENGDETGNRITNNLGMLSRRPPIGRHILQSDIDLENPERFPGPSTFWISNPSNTVTGNVVAGSEGTGFWMSFNHALSCRDHFCQRPDSRTPATIYPYQMPTTAFNDNVAKASMVGFTWDGVNDGELARNPRNPDDRMLRTVKYNPGRVTRFDRLSAYKNRMSAMYIRANTVEFRNMIMAANRVGFFSAYNSRLRESLLLGRTNSFSEQDAKLLGGITGVRIYDGPFDLDGVDFLNFDNFQLGKARITPRPFASIAASERFFNVTRRLRFQPEPEYRVYMGTVADGRIVGSNHQNIQDLDGSLLGSRNAGAYLYPDHPLNRGADCTPSPENFRGLICRRPSVNIYLGKDKDAIHFVATRLDRATGQTTPPAITEHYRHVIRTIVDNKRYEYTYVAPDSLRLEDTNRIRLIAKAQAGGLISPLITLKNLPGRNCSAEGGRQVASLEALRNSNDSAYFSSGRDFSFRIRADGGTDLLISSPSTPMAEGTLGALRCR